VADRVFRDSELAGQTHECVDSVGVYTQRLDAAVVAACGSRHGWACRWRSVQDRLDGVHQALRPIVCNGRSRFGGNDVGLRGPAEVT
jgi:hypothetical protein